MVRYHHENCLKKPEAVKDGGGSQHAKTSAAQSEIVNDGAGCSNEINGVNHDCEENVDQSVPTFDKQTLNEKNPTFTPSAVHTKKLNNKDIISYLREGHKKNGSLLLEKLTTFPEDFTYDQNGIVTIFGVTFPGCSIFHLLPFTFYSSDKEDISCIYSWLFLLKKHGLMHFAENPHLKKLSKLEETYHTVNSKWYYLGPVN